MPLFSGISLQGSGRRRQRRHGLRPPGRPNGIGVSARVSEPNQPARSRSSDRLGAVADRGGFDPLNPEPALI